MAFGLKYTEHKIMIWICQKSSGNQQADAKEMVKGNLSIF